MDEATMPSSDDGAGGRKDPNKWWQWVLVYPGLVIAIMSSVPTWLEFADSRSMGVPFGRSSYAEQQHDLWEKNADCFRSAVFTEMINPRMAEIGSMVCESGDILLRGQLPGSDDAQYKWISWTDLVEEQAALVDFFATTAAAAERQGERLLAKEDSSPEKILCQRSRKHGRLLQRIQTPDGCFDEVINTYNGKVVDREPAPCSPDC